jgi:hypothetical protein
MGVQSSRTDGTVPTNETVAMAVSVVRSLPPCAGYSICTAMVEGRDARGALYRRRCTRKAVFVIETPGRPSVTACRAHAGAAAGEAGPP